jgi:formylglycine-generating enzyme required for sulfatase activity
LKVPLLRSSADIQRFQREARIAAGIHHPHVCPVLDVGVLDGTHFLIMPYLEGVPLTEYTQPGCLLPQGQAADLVRRIALVLQSLHERGLMHRDLKPTNVMIRDSREPILMDFGLARSFADEGERVTSTGMAVGTPAYMSPEQINGDAEAMGPGCDIYSLGVILFELLTGRLPFQATRLEKLYKEIFLTPPPMPSEARRGIDPVLDWICTKAMAKKPDERFASMAEFAAALERLLSGRGYQPPEKLPAVDKEAEKAARARESRRRLRVALAAGLVLVLSGVGGTVWLGQGDRPSVAAAPALPTTRRSGVEAPPPADPPAAGPEARASASGAPEIAAERAGERPPAEVTNSIGMKLVWIPAGRFVMGSSRETGRSPDEGREHDVEITRPFYLGKYEVTQKQYQEVMGHNPSSFAPGGSGTERVAGLATEDFPVESVSWHEAVAFCAALGRREPGWVYRLPTEAEWEYACRGGSAEATPFHLGRSLSSEQANFDGNFPYRAAAGRYLQRPTRVGSYPANGFGLHDLHGNVWEWCSDWYEAGYYRSSPRQDPEGPGQGTRRVLRGGSWYSSSVDCRSASRGRSEPEKRAAGTGFRVVGTVGGR